MLGIAVSTIKYLVELRGWNGIALPIIHTRDAKIYLEVCSPNIHNSPLSNPNFLSLQDPGPWIIGISTEARHVVKPSSEVCICDL